MRVLDSKVMSYEEELVEYESRTEFEKDIPKRKANGWHLVYKYIEEDVIGEFHKQMKRLPVTKVRSGKGGIQYVSYRWCRYDHLYIG